MDNSNGFSRPIITNWKEAKKYFLDMGCSHFHMSRDYPETYKEYKNKNISRQTENHWRQEQFNKYFYALLSAECSLSDMWIIHSRMNDLIEYEEEMRTLDNLSRLLTATEHIKDIVPIKDVAMISETINGRSERRYRRGPIYSSYDLGNVEMARSFAELSQYLINRKSNPDERCINAINKCNKIKKELKL